MATTADPFDLERFVRAQQPIYATALAELQAGRKRSHWMWFIFPQYAGLGQSEMSRRYAIASLDEARHYLAHPVLGERLTTCARTLLTITERSAHAIFGSPDDVKLRSSMTLFAEAAGPDSAFAEVLAHLFQSERDPKTLALLRQDGGGRT